MDMRIFIADDDAGMRLVLRKIVESTEGMCYIGEAADGLETVRLCPELHPDVIFLDVKMPLLDGIAAAGELTQLLPDTSLVFVSAHSEYMPDAFEVYASDYLLKPFKTDRVRQTLRKLRKDRFRKIANPAPSLVIKNREGMTFIPINDILLLYRENKATHIVTAARDYNTSDSLNELWKKLSGGVFFRSHRAYIINSSAVSAIYPYGRWTYIVKIRGTDKDALITHEKLNELNDLLGI